MGKGGGECAARPAADLSGLATLSGLRADIRPADDTVPGMQAAAEHLRQVIRAGETIALFCDYDIDGTAAGTLMRLALTRAGATAEQLVAGYAHPTDGFGEMTQFIVTAADRGSRTLVICDCGSGQSAAVAQAQAAGMTVIIVDHHAPDADNPADFHLNPLAHERENHLSAAQLTWKLGAELEQQTHGMVAADWYAEPLALAAQGAIGDMVDLKHPENHAFYRIPLDEHPELPAPPAVRLLAGRLGEKLSNPYRLMRTRSALNLPKRTTLVSAEQVCDLLSARTDEQAAPLVEQLVRDYQAAIARRDQMQAAVMEDWERRSAGRNPQVAVAVVEGFPQDVGQAGLLAQRLMSEADLPAVVFADMGPDAEGQPTFKFSARPRRAKKTDPDNLVPVPLGELIGDPELLAVCKVARRTADGRIHHTVAVGGHPAAGVVSGSCRADQIDQVIACFERLAERAHSQMAAA